MQLKSSCSFYLLPWIQVWILFLLQWHAGIFLLDSRTPIKVFFFFFLIHGWLFKLVFLEGSQLQLWGPRARSWASSGSSAGTEVSVPFTWHMSGWDSSWIHRHNMLGHTSPHKGTFVHGWSSVVERGPPWRMSYSVTLLMSLEAAPKDAAWRRKRSRGPGILFLPCFNLLQDLLLTKNSWK